MNEDEIRRDVIELVTPLLGGKSVALRWLQTSNPNLGDITPAKMIDDGNGERLLKWAREQLEQNRRDQKARMIARKTR